MLARDVDNITQYYGQYAPQLLQTRYAKEIWALFEDGALHPEVELSGEFEDDTGLADVDAVLLEIKEALAEEESRLERLREADEA
jgi:RIO kinase 1